MDIFFEINNNRFGASNIQELLQKIKTFFDMPRIETKARVEGDFVIVSVEKAVYDQATKEFQKAVECCEKSNFDQAEEHLNACVKICPLHSEAYRLLAQISLQKGDLDKAIDYCVDSLRCNAKNEWALVLMGNIFYQKKDLKVALSYYESAIEVNPYNQVVLSNLSTLYLASGEYDKAEGLFTEIKTKDATFMNVYYGLHEVYLKKGDKAAAFDILIEGLKKGKDRPENPGFMKKMASEAVKTACEIRDDKQYLIQGDIEKIVEELRNKFKHDIRFEEDNTIPMFAKMEYAVAHRKAYSVVKYRSDKEFYEHLTMHEIGHLVMHLNNTQKGVGKKIMSDEKNFESFCKRYKAFFQKMVAKIGKEACSELEHNLCSGFITQALSVPLDLFVEKWIYNHEWMRPSQFVSLNSRGHLPISPKSSVGYDIRLNINNL